MMEYLHTMVRVTDLNQSLDFYCNKLGLREVRRTVDTLLDAAPAGVSGRGGVVFRTANLVRKRHPVRLDCTIWPEPII